MTQFPLYLTPKAERAIAEQRPIAFVRQVLHDDFCPAVHSQNDADCKPPCQPDTWLLTADEFVAFQQFAEREKVRRN